jgi:hypothetical protein
MCTRLIPPRRKKSERSPSILLHISWHDDDDDDGDDDDDDDADDDVGRLNSYWQGADWTLAERYTDVLKSLFVGFFFAVPLPSGLFITAFAMISTYLVDKYSLFRLWRRPTKIDESLGVLSRYFFVGIVFTHLSISRIYFANWPYRGLWGQDDGSKASCTFFACHVNRYQSRDSYTLHVFVRILMFMTMCLWTQ